MLLSHPSWHLNLAARRTVGRRNPSRPQSRSGDSAWGEGCAAPSRRPAPRHSLRRGLLGKRRRLCVTSAGFRLALWQTLLTHDVTDARRDGGCTPGALARDPRVLARDEGRPGHLISEVRILVADQGQKLRASLAPRLALASTRTLGWRMSGRRCVNRLISHRRFIDRLGLRRRLPSRDRRG